MEFFSPSRAQQVREIFLFLQQSDLTADESGSISIFARQAAGILHDNADGPGRARRQRLRVGRRLTEFYAYIAIVPTRMHVFHRGWPCTPGLNTLPKGFHPGCLNAMLMLISGRTNKWVTRSMAVGEAHCFSSRLCPPSCMVFTVIVPPLMCVPP